MTNSSDLTNFAAQIRLDSLKTLKKMGQGHLGGAFSIIELLAVLYGKQMRINPQKPNWSERDWLVLSKGHAGVALYSALANLGYFDKSLLETLNQGGTTLPSHPDCNKTVGIDATTGSLGQGTSIAAGIATGLRLKNKNSDVYLIVGDGELNEGQCWEAFQYIAHHKLNHCIVIIDENKKQLDGFTTDILNPFSIVEKMRAFGFKVWTAKGSDVVAIDTAITECKATKNQAVCLVLDSVKGQGVAYFEKLTHNHSVKFGNPEAKEACIAAIEALNEVVRSKKCSK
ncbi:MAG: transketolase [Streptococcaceae bacterium]|nr:transketolase [Streptococcaceae bacterium]